MGDIMKNFKQHLMNGVSYMIPVVLIGGVIMGLGITLGGNVGVPKEGSFAFFLFVLGKTGLNLMPAVIAGYIAFSIADKIALGPAFICGQLSQDIGAGFLGGIIAGFLVGIIVLYLKKIPVSKNFTALKNMILIPIVAGLLVAVFINYGVGSAIAGLMKWLEVVLGSMDTSNFIILGMVVGAITSFDLGLFGSKAYGLVCTSLLATVDPATGLPPAIATRLLLAGVCGSTIAPLICGFASVLLPKRFNEEEREAGKAALILGTFAITEGAIPFALNDPKRIYPAVILGSMAGCTTALLTGSGTTIAWGGIVAIPGTTGVLGYLFALAVGVLVGVLVIFLLKKAPVKTSGDTANHDVKVTQNGQEIDLDF